MYMCYNTPYELTRCAHMFIRRQKRPNGQVSIVLVEGYRVDGKVKQRNVAYLGTEADLIKDDPDAVKKLIEKYKTAESKNDAFVKLTVNLTEKISETNTIRNYGYFYLEKMYSELKLDETCKVIEETSGISYSLSECLKLLCFMRALYPSSKKACLENGLDYFYKDYDVKLESIYKSLTLLAKNKERFVKRMHQSLCEDYRKSTDILYYDVTNYYFEIDEGDEFRKKGCSKEHRPLPIVQMGLFMDQEGLPVDYFLYAGNKPDCKTLLPSFERVKKTYSTDKIIVTADKGLNSGENLGYLLSQGNGYIVSQRIRGAKKELVEQVLENTGWRSSPSELFEMKEFTRTIVVTYPDKTQHEHEQKIICIWSDKYRAKEKNERDNLLEKVAQLAADPKKFKRSCHQGMRKYIREVAIDKTTGEICHDLVTQTQLNEERIAKDEALDGYYLIVTSETELSASEILNKYRGLWRIEQSFRITKSDVKARPVYVRTKDHIEAHFLTCFMTLTMLRMLEIRLGRKYSCRRIIEGLNSAMATEMAKAIYSINRRDEVMQALDRCYRLEFNHRYVKAEDMRRFQSSLMRAVYTTPEN